VAPAEDGQDCTNTKLRRRSQWARVQKRWGQSAIAQAVVAPAALAREGIEGTLLHGLSMGDRKRHPLHLAVTFFSAPPSLSASVCISSWARAFCKRLEESTRVLGLKVERVDYEHVDRCVAVRL
jgi:hypothetical protein